MTNKFSGPLTYRDAGVDIDAGDALVDRIKPLAASTLGAGVLAGIGGFGALFEVPKKYREPVLVSGTDGVGTKLKLASQWGRHETIGIDLVAMCVNDILVQGAQPLFFLDYFACGKLALETATAVIAGVAQGCKQANCSLIGGETAEMPGMYAEGEYDLAGFAVGVVEKSAILDGKTIQAGDVILGLAANGGHANGYALIRKILADKQVDPRQDLAGQPLADVIMAPTRIYVKPVLATLAHHAQAIKGLAHITGGGLVGNIPRILPEPLTAKLYRDAWPMPPLFTWLQAQGNIADQEMVRVFNCGIGMIMVVQADQAEVVAATLRDEGETVYLIGEVIVREGGTTQTVVC